MRKDSVLVVSRDLVLAVAIEPEVMFAWRRDVRGEEKGQQGENPR
jgi:hypothetical protein